MTQIYMDYGPYSPSSSPPNSDDEDNYDLVYDSPSDEEIDSFNKEKSSIYKKIGVWFFIFIWILYIKYPTIFPKYHNLTHLDGL